MLISVSICTVTGKHRHGEDRNGSLDNVRMFEGTGKYAGYVIDMIETIRCFCHIAMYGCTLTMMAGVCCMMPETMSPYSDESSIVLEQEAGGVKDGCDVPDSSHRQRRTAIDKSLFLEFADIVTIRSDDDDATPCDVSTCELERRSIACPGSPECRGFASGARPRVAAPRRCPGITQD